MGAWWEGKGSFGAQNPAVSKKSKNLNHDKILNPKKYGVGGGFIKKLTCKPILEIPTGKIGCMTLAKKRRKKYEQQFCELYVNC